MWVSSIRLLLFSRIPVTDAPSNTAEASCHSHDGGARPTSRGRARLQFLQTREGLDALNIPVERGSHHQRPGMTRSMGGEVGTRPRHPQEQDGLRGEDEPSRGDGGAEPISALFLQQLDFQHTRRVSNDCLTQMDELLEPPEYALVSPHGTPARGAPPSQRTPNVHPHNVHPSRNAHRDYQAILRPCNTCRDYRAQLTPCSARRDYCALLMPCDARRDHRTPLMPWNALRPRSIPCTGFTNRLTLNHTKGGKPESLLTKEYGDDASTARHFAPTSSGSA